MKLRDDLSLLLLVVLFFTCVNVDENDRRIDELEQAAMKTARMEVADSIAKVRVDSILMAHSQEIE